MLMTPKQEHERKGAQAKKPQSSQQMRRGSQDETRLPADRQEVTEGTAVKQTTVPGEDRAQTNSSKHNDSRTKIPCKERNSYCGGLGNPLKKKESEEESVKEDDVLANNLRHKHQTNRSHS